MAKSRKSNRSSNKANESAEIKEDAVNTGDSVTAAEDQSAPGTRSEAAGVADAHIKADADQGAAGTDTPEDTVAATLESGNEDTGTDMQADTTASEETESAADASDSLADAEADTTEASTGDQVESVEAAETHLGDDRLEALDEETDREKSDDASGEGSLMGESSEDAADTAKDVPAAAAAPAPVAAPRSSIWPAVFGGVIAALVGFIAGRGDQLDRYLPASMQRPALDLTAIEAETAVLAQTDETLAERLAALEALPDRLAPLEALPARLEALEGRETPASDTIELGEAVSSLEALIAALADRVAALESRPVPSDDESVTPEELAALQQALAAQEAVIADLASKTAEAEARAASEAQRILARAALTRVITAVDSGAAFSPALEELEQAAPVEVPDPLRKAAEAGVPTMAQLQDSFPDAARAGLSAARADASDTGDNGITGFLRRQLNVRSVTPREGDDPDAILSRAEAAVRAGDLKTALSEMEGLPEAARSAMSDWLDAASARTVAQDAAGQLADSLNSN